MTRKRSQSVDVGNIKPSLYDTGPLARSSRQSIDFGSSGARLLNAGNRYAARRQSVMDGDRGRRTSETEKGRRNSRVSFDLGQRKHLSYDAWIRNMRVSLLF